MCDLFSAEEYPWTRYIRWRMGDFRDNDLLVPGAHSTDCAGVLALPGHLRASGGHCELRRALSCGTHNKQEDL